MVDIAAVGRTFLVEEGGKWRPPKVNEKCCKRPELAKLLRKSRGGGVIQGYKVFLVGFALKCCAPCVG